ncbi:hypothetical protein [Paraburkholderia caribensis]|uniref:hypothetical protein n=1 Tax=Paraburkholderia caribensis TaxID=75105 RepID=UPI001D088A86|nr:hypothetical protein [Paraburkholderia caribensis]
MSYWQVLIHTARAIPILLVDYSLWRSIRTHLLGLTIDICEIAGRVGAVLLFPVVVPIVSLLIAASMRRERCERESTSSSVGLGDRDVGGDRKVVWRAPREPLPE